MEFATAVNVCWLGVAAALVWVCIGRSSDRQALLREYRSVGLVVVCAGVVTILASTTSFFGLEYEDAFEYTYGAFALARHPELAVSGTNPVCLVGTLAQCDTWGSLSHPIGFTQLVRQVSLVLGESIRLGQRVSGALTGLSAVMLFVVGRRLGLGPQGAVLSSLFLLLTPSFFALGASGLAEPAGAFLVTTVLLCATTPVSNETSEPSARLSLAAGALAVAVTVFLAAGVKRENAILVFLLPLAFVPWLLRRSPRQALFRVRSLRAIVLGCLIAAIAVLAIGRDVLLNFEIVRPSNAPPFSMTNLVDLMPGYFGHLLGYQHYLALPFLTVLGFCRLKRLSGLWVPTALSIGYILMFCSFGQSYYYQALREVPSFHFVRYTIQIAPCLALLAGGGVEMAIAAFAGSKQGTTRKRVVLFMIAAYFCVSTVFSWRLREAYSRDEESVRIQPTLAICNAVPTRSVLITAEPILANLLCSDSFFLVDYEAVGKFLGDDGLGKLLDERAVYVCERPSQGGVDPRRFPESAHALDKTAKEQFFEWEKGDTWLRVVRLHPRLQKPRG